MLAVGAATPADSSSTSRAGGPPKLFVRGEYYVGTAVLAALTWVLGYTAGLNDWGMARLGGAHAEVGPRLGGRD